MTPSRVDLFKIFRYLVLSLVISFPVICFSQLSTYDLREYKQPDFRIASLVFRPDFNFNFSDTENSESDASSRLTNNLLYNDYQFSRKKVVNHSQTFLMNITALKDAHDIYDFEWRFSYDRQNFSAAKRFINYTFSGNTRNTTDANNVFNFNGSFDLYKGWGRIEDVTNAWFANQILKDQNVAGFLGEGIEHKFISGLADTITMLRNLRFFDPRHGAINQIDKIAQYLQDADIGFNPNASAYAHLYDSWRYERFYRRGHGKEFRIGVSPTFQYRRNDWPDRQRIISKSYFIPLSLNYRISNVISQDWQLNHSYTFRTGFYASEIKAELADYIPNILSIVDMWWQWSYLPSVRTIYSLTPNFIYSRNLDLDSDFVTGDIRLLINGNIRHYYSPRLSLTVFANCNYNNYVHNPFNNSDRISFNCGIGLDYNIF